MHDLPKTVMGFYWKNIKQSKWFYGPLCIIIICSSVIGKIMSPISNKLIFSLFEMSLSVDNWLVASIPVFGIVFGMYFVQNTLRMISTYMQNKKNPVLHDIRREWLFNYLYRQDWMFFVNNSAGKLSNLVNKVTDNFFNLTIDLFTNVIGILIGVLINIGLIMFVDARIAIMGISIIGIKTIWYIFLRKKLDKASKEQSKMGSKFNGIKVDSLENFNAIKIFNGSEIESKIIKNERLLHIEAQRKTFFINRLISFPDTFIRSGMDIAVYVFLVYLFVRGQILVSDVAMITAAFWTMFNNLAKLSEMIPDFTEKHADARQAYEELTVVMKVLDKHNAKALKIKNGTIELKNVTFRYNKKGAVVDDFSIKINGGEKIGLVGRSGEGKTTIVHLLLRLFDVSDGKILIDGTDIRNCTQKSLRENISFVPQDNKLFNRTILENIRYGNWNGSRAKVIDAAKRANIHDFIMTTPEKYNTIVGNNGIKLSGGQRQRIAIARAILRGAPILIFDEATSALDSENEIAIQNSLEKLMIGRTTIVIAHRLSTLRKMDRILVMENGKVVEVGSHDELMKKHNGIYAKMHKRQNNNS
ncbi:MAG: ABC transporter ATP-binding protein [Alphaproteobacteria bacterium]|nr:ABC transporter ATP-binding protein [Alphaproteobacteria bacterium]MBN2675013.1 ABC transporter ATP-binding protein [Alphaproteobacteria bacterium]